MAKNDVAIVIPVYNHGETIADVINDAITLGFPLFVVDDGSTDKTGQVLDQVSSTVVLRHEKNKGKGAALVTGMKKAAESAQWAVTMDADGQHFPQDAKTMLSAIPCGNRPIVVGVREGMETAPWTSRFGRKFSNFWVWVSGGPMIADSQSGFRVYPLPEAIDLDVKSGGYQYEIEVLVKAARSGIPIFEAPIRVAYKTKVPRISHFHPFFDFLRNSKTFSRLIIKRMFTPKLWPGAKACKKKGSLKV